MSIRSLITSVASAFPCVSPESGPESLHQAPLAPKCTTADFAVVAADTHVSWLETQLVHRFGGVTDFFAQGIGAEGLIEFFNNGNFGFKQPALNALRDSRWDQGLSKNEEMSFTQWATELMDQVLVYRIDHPQYAQFALALSLLVARGYWSIKIGLEQFIAYYLVSKDNQGEQAHKSNRIAEEKLFATVFSQMSASQRKSTIFKLIKRVDANKDCTQGLHFSVQTPLRLFLNMLRILPPSELAIAKNQLAACFGSLGHFEEYLSSCGPEGKWLLAQFRELILIPEVQLSGETNFFIKSLRFPASFETEVDQKNFFWAMQSNRVDGKTASFCSLDPVWQGSAIGLYFYFALGQGIKPDQNELGDFVDGLVNGLSLPWKDGRNLCVRGLFYFLSALQRFESVSESDFILARQRALEGLQKLTTHSFADTRRLASVALELIGEKFEVYQNTDPLTQPGWASSDHKIAQFFHPGIVPGNDIVH